MDAKAVKKRNVKTVNVPWVEKYRPQELTDIVGNEETITRLISVAKDGNMPNLILSGPPGTGKTTSIHCLARALLGCDGYRYGVLELNASDARGIDVVRNKIKGFAMQKIKLPPNRHKIVILDEADSMTPSAQQALRRTMEIYSNTTRFALACNNSTKIIEPIQSRAAILRYSRLNDEQILQRLRHVCGEEDLSYEEEGLGAIIFTAEGDMRHALNNLQATYTGFQQITQANVFKVCDQPHPAIVNSILQHCAKGDTNKSVQEMRKLWNTGYSSSDIIGTLFKVTKSSTFLGEAEKLEFLKEIGFTHMRIADGISSLLQLLGLLSRLSNKIETQH